MALIAPILNTNFYTYDLSWMQKGYTYGVNDSGPWQKFSRRGLNTSIEIWYNTLCNAGWNVTVTRQVVNDTSNQGHALIEASAGWPYPYLYGTETPENAWELDPQDNQKGLLDSDFPNLGVSLNVTSRFTRIAIAKMLEDTQATWFPAGSAQNSSSYGFCQTSDTSFAFDDGSLTMASPNNPIVTSSSGSYSVQNPGSTPQFNVVHLPSSDYSPAYSLYLLMKAGVENYPVEASSIRHTLVTSSQYYAKASFINQGRIISSASMTSVEGAPSTLLFSVPTLPSPLQFIEVSGDLQYGWRKIRPQVARLSRLKWRIVQNYQFGLWATKIFGNPI